jgi:glucosyl-dolichyl phosphate glucuronosyltransferase
MPELSVVVSTHNRPILLKQSILSLIEQSLGASFYEIIVADSYSENNGIANDDVIKNLQKDYPNHNIIYFYEKVKGGYTHTRNQAIKKANGELIVCGDDDFSANPNYLESCVSVLKNNSVGAVTGPLLPHFEDHPPHFVEDLYQNNEYGWYLSDFTLFDFGNQVKKIPYNFVFASNIGFRKDVYLECGGFGPDGFGGDLVLYNGTGETLLVKNIFNAGYDIIYHPGMSARHYVSSYRFKKKYFESRGYYYGVSQSFRDLRENGLQSQETKPLMNTIINRIRYIRDLYRFNGMIATRNLAICKGYLDHKRAVMESPLMLEYVMRENWLNYDFSKLPPLKNRSPSLWE